MKSEIKVGVFVFFSFALILLTLIYLGRSSFDSEGKEYIVTFTFLNDLKSGAEVKYAGGILIGFVKDIKREGTTIKVHLWIQKDFPLTSNVQISIMGEGFLGEKYLNISFVTTEEPITELPEKSIIEGHSSASMGDVLNNVNVLALKTTEAVDNINVMLSGMSQRKDIEKISRHAVKVLNETAKIIENNKDNINQVIQEAVESVKSINILMSRELPRILRNANTSVTGVATEVGSLIEQLKGILTTVKKGEGLLGKMMVDPRLAKDLEDTLRNLRKISERLMEYPFLQQKEKPNEKFPWGRN